VNSDQPAAPEPPHALGALTTSELSRYRRDLERALNDRTIGMAPVAESIRTRLAAVLDEEIQRSQIRNAGRTWPVSN
jgi:hypothetical protein